MVKELHEKEELKKKIEEAFHIEASIKLRIGMMFHEAEKIGVWEEGENLRDFLGSLGRKRANTSTVNRRLNNYRALCTVGGYYISDIETIDDSRISWIRKVFFSQDQSGDIKQVASKLELEDWIQKARPVHEGGLSTTDWNIEKRVHLHLTITEHDHTWSGKEYWDCKLCGQRTWVEPN